MVSYTSLTSITDNQSATPMCNDQKHIITSSYVSVGSYSFNSVIPQVQSFITVILASDHLPLHTIKCRSVVFDVTLRLLVIHFVVVSRHKQTLSLTSD